MDLRRWLEQRGRGSVSQLVRDTGLSHPTVYAARDGGDILLSTAKRIVDATGGEVTLADLGVEHVEEAS